MTLSQALATPVGDTVQSTALVPRQWVSPRAAMPRMPKRCVAQEGQRSVGQRVQLRDGLARPWGRQRRTRQVRPDHARLGQKPLRAAFSVQQTSLTATYREILERRARENQVDFVEGVTTALTPLAFFEDVMVKELRNWSTRHRGRRQHRHRRGRPASVAH